MLWYYQAFKLLQQKFTTVWGCMLKRCFNLCSGAADHGKLKCAPGESTVVTAQSTYCWYLCLLLLHGRHKLLLRHRASSHPLISFVSQNFVPLQDRKSAPPAERSTQHRLHCASALGRSGSSSPMHRGAILRLLDTAEWDQVAEMRVLLMTNNLHASWCTQNHSATVVQPSHSYWSTLALDRTSFGSNEEEDAQKWKGSRSVTWSLTALERFTSFYWRHRDSNKNCHLFTGFWARRD